jgi:hypothetical protein
MASAWMATATPLTLATVRSGRSQPNPQRRPAVWRRRRLGTACRGSVPASIGWAQRPSGGRTRELAWTRRPTPPPGQGVSNQTRRNRPNPPDRTHRRGPAHRTPVRRSPAPPSRRPASSRRTGPPRPRLLVLPLRRPLRSLRRPLRRRVPVLALPRPLLRRPAAITTARSLVPPRPSASEPPPSRCQVRPSGVPGRSMREAGNLHRARRPRPGPAPTYRPRPRPRPRRGPRAPSRRRPRPSRPGRTERTRSTRRTSGSAAAAPGPRDRLAGPSRRSRMRLRRSPPILGPLVTRAGGPAMPRVGRATGGRSQWWRPGRVVTRVQRATRVGGPKARLDRERPWRFGHDPELAQLRTRQEQGRVWHPSGARSRRRDPRSLRRPPPAVRRATSPGRPPPAIRVWSGHRLPRPGAGSAPSR